VHDGIEEISVCAGFEGVGTSEDQVHCKTPVFEINSKVQWRWKIVGGFVGVSPVAK